MREKDMRDSYKVRIHAMIEEVQDEKCLRQIYTILKRKTS